jgi:hypothetical protein
MRAVDRTLLSRVQALASLTLLAGCTLTTSLEGLSDHRVSSGSARDARAGDALPIDSAESIITLPDGETAESGDDAGEVVDSSVDDPCPDGACRNPLCSNGELDGDETAIDCGGSCAPCAPDRRCLQSSDCASKVCSLVLVAHPDSSSPDAEVPETDASDSGVVIEEDALDATEDKVCQAPQCNDRVMNGAESDVDCGGTCPRCLPGARCGSWIDCSSSVCTNGKCSVPSCTDGVKNGDETGVDCGAGCPKCPVGQGCLSMTDCLTSACEGGVCQATSCTDHVKNGAETDIDCGGGTCPKCGNGYRCANKSDCQSGQCAGGTCRNGF